MPSLDPATRNIAIDRLQAGESQNEVARTLNANQSTISRLWNRFQHNWFRNRFRQHGIRPIRPLVQQIKVLDIPKLAKNLVQRRVSFSSADIRVYRHRNERFSSSCVQEVDSFG